ncbi:MAG: hypothetical protein AAF891_09765 [Pseudomonadota bacterium]
MPRLIKFYITHVLIGFAAAAVFVGLTLYFNIANIAHLVTHTEGGWLALVVFWVLNGIVFAGVQFAIAIMSLGRRDDDDEHKGGPGQLIPVRVPAKARDIFRAEPRK